MHVILCLKFFPFCEDLKKLFIALFEIVASVCIFCAAKRGLQLESLPLRNEKKYFTPWSVVVAIAILLKGTVAKCAEPDSFCKRLERLFT